MAKATQRKVLSSVSARLERVLDVVTFATFDPAVCGNTKSGPGTMSPLEGAYDVATP